MTVRMWKNKLTKQVKQGEDVLESIGISYPCFREFPDIFKLTKEDEGKDIWVAGHYRTFDAKLKEVDEGELKIVTIRDKEYKTIFPNEAILHPSEIDQERLEAFGYEIIDRRKS